MTRIAKPALAAAFAIAAVLAASAPSAAATRLRYLGVGQHAAVMNSVRQAQQQNNAAISRVQNNIRSTQPKGF